VSTILKTHEPICPTDKETALAREAGRGLSPVSGHELQVLIPETNESITLPASAVRLLVEMLSEMAEGNAIAVTPIHAELTTKQASDLLGVSRPFLVKQLESGLIPFRKVGTHRRILFTDLQAYKQQIDKNRLEALEELTAQAQDLNMGY
jgi:excisionase family DNA binding protein